MAQFIPSGRAQLCLFSLARFSPHRFQIFPYHKSTEFEIWIPRLLKHSSHLALCHLVPAGLRHDVFTATDDYCQQAPERFHRWNFLYVYDMYDNHASTRVRRRQTIGVYNYKYGCKDKVRRYRHERVLLHRILQSQVWIQKRAVHNGKHAKVKI